MTKKKTPTAKPAKSAKAETKPAEAESTSAEANAIAPGSDAIVSEETKPKSKPPEVDVEVSSCPRCQSTSRIGYHSTKARKITGTTKTGKPYKLVVWKRTQCRNCGQNRVDVFYLNRKPVKADGVLLGSV